MPKTAALRAAVFKLFTKNSWVVFKHPPSGARVKWSLHASKTHDANTRDALWWSIIHNSDKIRREMASISSQSTSFWSPILSIWPALDSLLTLIPLNLTLIMLKVKRRCIACKHHVSESSLLYIFYIRPNISLKSHPIKILAFQSEPWNICRLIQLDWQLCKLVCQSSSDL